MKTLDEQIRCIERELALRRNVYPRQVLQGKMRPDIADHEIAAMEAVLKTLQQLKQPTLM